jgi:hypothetical protein
MASGIRAISCCSDGRKTDAFDAGTKSIQVRLFKPLTTFAGGSFHFQGRSRAYGAALILTHQPGRADSVHNEDRCQPALLARQMLSSEPRD